MDKHPEEPPMALLQTAVTRMRVLGQAGFPKPPTTQPEVQRQLGNLDPCVGVAEPAEELKAFLLRTQPAAVAQLRRSELNRVLRGAWYNGEFDDLGVQAVERAELDHRRSSDQAIIDGYLTYFPIERASLTALAAAAQRASKRHHWAWEQRSQKWALFDPSRGPSLVGRDLAQSQDRSAEEVLTGTGLGRSIAATMFGRRAFIAGCHEVAALQGAAAAPAQRRLLHLFDSQEQAGDLPHLVQALLQPWTTIKPEPDHRKLVSEFLIRQVGDPRILPGRWTTITNSLAARLGPDQAFTIVQVLKRWLTDVAMREFFRAIAKATDRPDQWKQRSNFWLAYLDAGLVSDAWPALGVRAKTKIEELIRQSGERPEFGVMGSGPVSSSTIIMQVGDLRIAEWSDNGACRFWRDDDPRAPKLYDKKYDGAALRTTSGRSDFEYESHVPVPGWEGKFAGIVHRRTGIAHPHLGRGRGRHWNETW